MEDRFRVSPARCAVEAEKGYPAPRAGSAFTVRIAVQAISGTVLVTVSQTDSERISLGAVRLPAGKTTLPLAPVELSHNYIFGYLRRAIL